MSIDRSAVQRTYAQLRDLVPHWTGEGRSWFDAHPGYPTGHPERSRRSTDGASARDNGRPELWAQLVGGFDAALRRWYSIEEFTDDPVCILRLGMGAARESVRLGGGMPSSTEIREGEPIGTLHLWNEHLPRYVSGGPDINWASEIRRRAVRSLQLLAAFVERDPHWQEVRAFQGEATLSSRLGALQLNRVASRYGFELVDTECSFARQLHQLGDSFCRWGLTSAYNPAALARQRFFRPYHELWIPRTALVGLYLRQPGRSGQSHPDMSRETA
jgi:hypothetical protein